MSGDAFERENNYRVADRCCANCRHGRPEYDGAATCLHPRRRGSDAQPDNLSHNVGVCYVCDAWEKRGL